MAPLPLSFYARPSPEVARDLLGCLLVRRLGNATLVGRIVETEAYGEEDPASHSFRGKTPRTQVMFGRAGHLYVYFTYGMHFCMNVVTGKEGEGSAVLLRAAEPLRGVEIMKGLRGQSDARLLCSGPARLTQAFAVERDANGLDLVQGREMFVAAGAPVDDQDVEVGPRVGIRLAAERPWRFHEAGNAYVSKAPSPAARSGYSPSKEARADRDGSTRRRSG